MQEDGQSPLRRGCNKSVSGRSALAAATLTFVQTGFKYWHEPIFNIMSILGSNTVNCYYYAFCSNYTVEYTLI